MGQLDEATADFKKTLELNPAVVAAHMMLSQIYVMQGRPQDALAEIERARSALIQCRGNKIRNEAALIAQDRTSTSHYVR